MFCPLLDSIMHFHSTHLDLSYILQTKASRLVCIATGLCLPNPPLISRLFGPRRFTCLLLPMTALGTRILSAFLSSSQTKSVSDSSDSGSISLADKLPGLRSPSSNKQADDLSSALSSVSAATSQLSSVSEDSSQADRSRRRRRVNNINNLKGRGGARSPSPSSSESSDGQDSSDEDVNGNLKKGHKKYLQAGLYSKTTVLPDASLSNDKSLAQEASESTVDSKSSILDFGEVASTATPTPEPEAAEEADAPATTTTHSGEPTPRPRMNKRASSLAAQTKFARNGRGIRPPPKTSSQSSGSSSKKAAPPAPPIPDAPLSLPEHFKGPLLPLPIEWGEVLLEENRDFELPHPIHRDYRPYGPGRQRMLRKAGKDKQPSKYMVIRQSELTSTSGFQMGEKLQPLITLFSPQTTTQNASRSNRRSQPFANVLKAQSAAMTASTG